MATTSVLLFLVVKFGLFGLWCVGVYWLFERQQRARQRRERGPSA